MAEPDAVASFASLVRRWRLAAGLSQEALASRAGLSVEAIRRLEQGTRTAPRRETVALLAAALKLPPADRARFEAAVSRARLPGSPDHAWGMAPAPITVPQPLSSFVGRERLLASVREALIGSRLLTLTGPGGVGKTRLALHVAAGLLPHYRDGVWLVELASLIDPALVPSTIAAALGIRERPGQSLPQTIAQTLGPKRLLLVLDNFEHLLAAAPLIPELLTGSPGVQALVTSRAALRVSGEREVPVPPLTVPDPRACVTLQDVAASDAGRLFAQRAEDIRPDFTLTETNAAAVAGICRELDGLPLAIELAAARIRHLPAPAILSRLASRLPLLTGGARDRPTRHQTLRGAIAWSYHLLTPAEQVAFRRLGIVAGGCTLEAAAVVVGPITPATAPSDVADPPRTPCDTEPAILDILAALVEQGLLRSEEDRGGEPRFRMLETIREYALEQLAAGRESEVIRRQHAAYYLDLAERAAPQTEGPESRWWLERLDADHDNLRQALSWFADHDPTAGLRLGAALTVFWRARGHAAEGRRRLASLLTRPGAQDRTRARALRCAADLAHAQRDHAAAWALSDEGLTISRACDDRLEVALALDTSAAAAGIRGDVAIARARFAESLALYREVGDQLRVASILINLSDIARQANDAAGARACLDESIAQARAAGSGALLAWAIAKRGVLAHDDQDYASARVDIEEGVRRMQAEGDQHLGAHIRVALGYLALGQEDYAAAREQFAAVREQTNRLGAPSPHAHLGLGAAALGGREYAAAGRHFAAGLRQTRDWGERQNMALAIRWCAALAAAQGQPLRTVRLAAAATALEAAIKSRVFPLQERLFDRWLAPARRALDDSAREAAEAAGRAMTVAQAIDDALASAEMAEPIIPSACQT